METKYNQTEEVEIDLREIFMLLAGKLWLIILISIIGGAIACCISIFLIPESFESTTKIYILNRQEENTVTYSDVQLGSQLTKDYAELIQSRLVLEEVIEKLGLVELDYEEMLKKVEVTTPTDTRILSITVSDYDPQMAMNIANGIREAAAVHIKNVMDIEAVNVVETANFPAEKASPSILKWTLGGACIGGVLIVAILLLIYFLDDTIKTSDDVEKYLGLSTLAMIPMANQGKK